MRMPGMDGAELLSIVRERHPTVVRVILSGQTDEAAMLRAVHVAHRLLAKPCPAEGLYEVIRRTHLWVTGLHGSGCAAAVAQIGVLPTPPGIYLELTEILRDNDVALDAIVAIVGRDPALCARTLQLANSSFFSRVGSPVSHVRQAVARVGTRLLRSLSLSEGILGKAAGGAAGQLVERMQQHALSVADAALHLGSASGARDDGFTAALLHGVGLLALVAADPGLVDLSRRVCDGRKIDPVGVSSAEMGAYLLDLWGLPKHIVEAVLLHDAPEAIAPKGAVVAALTHVADALVKGQEPNAGVVAAYSLDAEVRRWRADHGDAS
jgi:HD-like signal output (HDOD) protein